MPYVYVRLDQVVDQLLVVADSFPGNSETNSPSSNLAETVREIAAQVKEFSLDGQAMNRLLLSPLREQLISRYGSEDGTSRYGEVVKAFRG